jgi:hypothetical protein
VITALAVLAALVALALPGTAAAQTAAACTAPQGFEPRVRLASGDLVLLFRTVPPAIEIGTHFRVEAVVCAGPPGIRGLRMDAEMPEHRHGMNYLPRVAPAGDGRYTGEGFLFHMPGLWRFLFDVERAGRVDRLTSEVEIE